MDLNEQQRKSPGFGLVAIVLVVAVVIGAVGGAFILPRLSALAASAAPDAYNVVSSIAAGAVKSPATASASRTATVTANPNQTAGPNNAVTTGATPIATAVPTTVPANTQSTAPTSAAAEGPYVVVVHKVGPAVVTVVNQLPATAGFGGVSQPEALGSGVIVDTAGHIVTNNHVVAGGGKFQVIFSDARKVTAQLVGRDQISDVAVLKVDGPVPAVAEFGDSSTVEPGQEVVAIGSALGNFRNTVTHGIISGTDRTLSDPSGAGLSGLLQTDAPINHGNSGGPLLDLTGNIVGLNTAVVRSTGTSMDVAEGLGFAIPSNTVKQISDQLIKSGSVPRPYLGISYDILSPQVAAYYGLSVTEGALIRSVETGSPADKAGIKQGDVVTAIGGTTVDEEHPLATALLSHQIGDTVQLTVTRDGQTETLTATLGQRPNTAQ